MLCSELCWLVCAAVGGRRSAWQLVCLTCCLSNTLNMTCVCCEPYSASEILTTLEKESSWAQYYVVSPNTEELCACWAILFL